MQQSIPCTMMRGGTSRGLYFHANDLPRDPAARDRVLIACIGATDPSQVDGAGGGTSITSKVAIVSRSDHPDADVDYLFAQVCVDRPTVDTAPSCGNILAGVGPFAIEAGLVAAVDGETVVRVRSVNTGALADCVVQTPGRAVRYDGETTIDGVPGTAAPVRLTFRNIAGGRTGRLLPTGNVRDTVCGVPVTCIDLAIPMVLVDAASVGKTGYETKAELDGDAALLSRLETIRRAAALKMGLGDVSGSVVPKVAILARSRGDRGISSRYFVPDRCHAAHAATGAVCVAGAALIDGSIAHALATCDRADTTTVRVEHPKGAIEIRIAATGEGSAIVIAAADIVRTARLIFSGQVHVPAAAAPAAVDVPFAA